jgi:Right handed beta helix region
MGPVTCAPGFAPLPDGVGCDAVIPANDCPAGTMAQIGSTACVPVGTTQCPAGFVPQPTGWGCADVLPTQPCTGATLEVLGQATCQPVGDCSAPFPPPAATLFVSPTVTPDATHFQTIGAAIAAATPGATIAVDSGTYTESVAVTGSLSIVGRCAGMVTVQAPAADAAGLDVSGATATISGLTFQGHRPGVVIEKGAKATLSGLVIDGNRDVGLIVQNAGTIATVTDTVVRGTLNPNGYGWGAYASLGASLVMTSSAIVGNVELGLTLTDSGSTTKLTGVTVRGTTADPSGMSNGIGVQVGTQLTMDTSAVVDNQGSALTVTGAQTSATVTSSILRDTTSSPAGTGGNGLVAGTGANVAVHSSWFVRDAEVSVSVSGKGTTVTLDGCDVLQTKPNAQGQFGAGVGVQQQASLKVTQSAIVDAVYYGVFVSDTGTVGELDQSLVSNIAEDSVDHLGRGVDVQAGGKGILQASTVTNTATESLIVDSTGGAADLNATQTLVLQGHPSAYVRLGGSLELTRSALIGALDVALYLTADGSSTGVHSQATVTDSVIRDVQLISGTNGMGVVSGGIVSLTRVTIRNVFGASVLAGNNTGADGGLTTTGSKVTMQNSVVRDTNLQPGANGFGVGIAGLDGTVFDVQGCTIENNVIGIGIQSGTASVSGSTVANNQVGIDVQGSSSLMQVDSVPSQVGTGEVLVTSDTTFVGNQTTLSSMALPLPGLPASDP